MKRLITILLVLISFSSYSQVRGYNVTAKNQLETENLFKWQGDLISKESLVYVEMAPILNPTQIRFRHINGVWSKWFGGFELPFIPTSIWEMNNVDNTGWAVGKVLKFTEFGNLVVGNDETGIGGTGIGYADLGATSPLSYNNTTGVFSVSSGFQIPTTTEFSNFTTAFSWGNHSGLYVNISDIGKVSTGGGTPYYLSPDWFISSVGYIYPKINQNPALGIDLPVSAGGVYNTFLTKQDNLISGTNIKTVMGQSLLGSGDVPLLKATAITLGGFKTGGTPPAPGYEPVQMYNDFAYVSINKNDIEYALTGEITSHTHPGGTGGGVWGTITGTLSSQIDLQTALNAKASLNGSSSQMFRADRFRFGTDAAWNIYGSGTNLEFNFNNITKATLSPEGLFTATNIAGTSDRRLKEHIKPIKSKISNVQLYQFEMKADRTDRKRYGAIAQEVEDIAPELVFTDNNGYKSIAYIDMLIAMMDELREENKKLWKEVKRLKKRK